MACDYPISGITMSWIVKTAFDIRLELVDHTQLETLPGEDEKPVLKAFHERKKKAHDSIDGLFGEDLQAKKKKEFAKMEEELKKFQKGGKGAPPPGSSPTTIRA